MKWEAIVYAVIGFLYRIGGRERLKKLIDSPNSEMDERTIKVLDMVFSAKTK